MFAVSVCHSSEQTDLREGHFVDTVNVRFGLLFDLVSVRFVTDCAVYQRLHERTQTKKKESGQAPRPSKFHFFFFFLRVQRTAARWTRRNSPCRFWTDSPWSRRFPWDSWWLWGRSGGRCTSRRNQAEGERSGGRITRGRKNSSSFLW